MEMNQVQFGVATSGQRGAVVSTDTTEVWGATRKQESLQKEREDACAQWVRIGSQRFAVPMVREPALPIRGRTIKWKRFVDAK